METKIVVEPNSGLRRFEKSGHIDMAVVVVHQFFHFSLRRSKRILLVIFAFAGRQQRPVDRTITRSSRFILYLILVCFFYGCNHLQPLIIEYARTTLIYRRKITIITTIPSPIIMYKVGGYYIGRYLYVIPIRLVESVVDDSEFVVFGTFSRIDISVGNPGMSSFIGIGTSHIDRLFPIQILSDRCNCIIGKARSTAVSENFEST